MSRRLTFERACAQYVHRYTMDHVPSWSQRRPVDDGGTAMWYYAPHFRSDREWYENTKFPGEPDYLGISKRDCYTTGQTWPLGQRLARPYRGKRFYISEDGDNSEQMVIDRAKEDCC